MVSLAGPVREPDGEDNGMALAQVLGIGLFAVGAVTAAGLYATLITSLPRPRKDPTTGEEVYEFSLLPDWAQALVGAGALTVAGRAVVKSPLVKKAVARVAVGVGSRMGGKVGVHLASAGLRLGGRAAAKAATAASVAGLVVTVGWSIWDAGRFAWDVSQGKAKADPVEFLKYQSGLDNGSTPIMSALGLG